jgi:hypothetical protein
MCRLRSLLDQGNKKLVHERSSGRQHGKQRGKHNAQVRPRPVSSRRLPAVSR